MTKHFTTYYFGLHQVIDSGKDTVNGMVEHPFMLRLGNRQDNRFKDFELDYDSLVQLQTLINDVLQEVKE